MKCIRYCLFFGFGILFLFAFVTSCGFTPPPGSPQSGYSIYGFVGKTVEIPAAQENVLLLNGNTKQTIDMGRTNQWGHYKFLGLPPGLYIVQAGDKQFPVFIKNENLRQDINLSAADGKMDYIGHYLKEGLSTTGLGPPGEPELVQHFAGMWASYSGISGGGTLLNFYFYRNGAFSDASESSYTSETPDASYGSVGTDSSQAHWKIQGNKQAGQITLIFPDGSQKTVNYRVHVENGQPYWREYKFNDRHFSKRKDF
ncbi:MAG: hypothetical protein JSW04_08115 [Desulfobacterales bacterium]|nr:MAG: hypothetical protein JSW04_08115 [Desulfobacterales bacterium]